MTSELSRHTILLVEDNPHDVALLRRTLQEARLLNPVHEAADGQAAIDYLAGTGSYADRATYPLPALVLLDLGLPRRAGHQVLAWLLEHPPARRVPVVVLTGSSRASDQDRAVDLGANAYLSKPVSLEALLATVKTLGLPWAVLAEPHAEERR